LVRGYAGTRVCCKEAGQQFVVTKICESSLPWIRI
jgi:hypothetical protein